MPITLDHQETVERQAFRNTLLAIGHGQTAIESMMAQYDRRAATRAQGLEPCECGAPAVTRIRCRALYFDARCCPKCRDNVLESFRGLRPVISEKQWTAKPLNSAYWDAIVQAER